MIRRPTERSLALATNFLYSINGKTETQMVLQKGNVGRLFLWDKHRIIHNYFLVKVFVPMANSFQMIKHDSKTIQLKRILFLVLSIARYVHWFIFYSVVFYRHADCCQFGTFICNPETLSGMATTLQSSIMVQSSYVLKKVLNCTIASENAIFSHLSLLAFETNPQGHFMGIFSSRFHSFGQLWKFNSGQWALEYTRAVLFGARLIWLLPVANNATQHGLSDNSNEYLIQKFSF